MPLIRYDPRFLEIGKQSPDISVGVAPMRKKRRSVSSSTVSRNSSPSRTQTDSLDNFQTYVPRMISQDDARSFVDNFRSNVLDKSTVCVVTGAEARL